MYIRSAVHLFLAFAVAAPVPALGFEGRASEVVTSYVSGTSPTLILGFDNNLEICLALREPMTVEELAANGVPATRSQIVLLRLWNLLESDEDGVLRCTVPVIEPPISDEMSALSREVAEQILETARDRIDSYIATVDAAGWRENGFALLGSFVLDGLVWEALALVEAIQSAEASTIPSGSEYWSGVTWITLPPRPSKLGTNSHSSDHGMLYSAWSPTALEAQAVLQRSGLREALLSVALSGSSVDEAHSSTLQELGLVRGGVAQIPAIDATSPLCREGGELARRIAKTLVEAPAVEEMLRKTGARDDSVAMIMAYHWIYPELLRQLESTEFQPPPLLAGQPGGELAPTLLAVALGTECVAPIN